MASPRPRRYAPRSQAFSPCRGGDPASAHKPRHRREPAPVEPAAATARCRVSPDPHRLARPLTARSRPRLRPSRSPDTHLETTPPAGAPGDARCATILSPARPTDGSYAPSRRSRLPRAIGNIRFADFRPADFADPFGDQLGHRIVVTGSLDPRWCALHRLRTSPRPFDGLVGGAAQLRGTPVRPDLLIGRNDVHAVPRRLQWNSPVVAVCGWHLHRHHRGLQFLIDTTNTGWGLLSGHQWGPPLGHQWGLFHGHGHLPS